MADDPQIETVQHPVLGPLKFPASMPYDERNASIQRALATMPPKQQSLPTDNEGLGTKIGRGAALGGFSGLGIPETVTPVSDLAKGLNQQVNKAATTPWGQGGPIYGTIAMIGNMLKGTASGEWQSGKEAYQGVSQGDPELASHGLSSALTRLLMLKGMTEVPDSVSSVPGGVRGGVQDALGVGKNFIRQGAEKVGDENAALLDKHTQATQDTLAAQKSKIDQAKISEPQAFAEAEAKHQQKVDLVNKANSESQGGYHQRLAHVDIADESAQKISDTLPNLYQRARAEAGAAYGPQPKGTFDHAELKDAIEDAAQSKLQGNTKLPTAVSKIISDIDKPPEPSLLDQASVFKGAGKSMRGQGKQLDSSTATADQRDMISRLDPKAREKFLGGLSEQERSDLTQPESSPTKTTPIDAQRIHGFMSELGKAAQSGSLSGDEVSSINATRVMLEGRLRKLYDNEGRLSDFQNGQAAWKQMANTFENTASTAKGGSPVARALATKDPVTGNLRSDYVQSILGDDKAHPVAQELLGRYKHLGAPTSDLDVMKTNLDAAKNLPNLPKWKAAPSGPEYPNFTKFGKLPETPDAPTLKDYDPVDARKVALKQKASSLSGTGGPYGIMRDVMGMKGALMGNPMALSYPVIRRLLGGGVGSESVMKWLSKATPEELKMAKDIPASKVALKKAKNP